jgi:hypothetical protein
MLTVPNQLEHAIYLHSVVRVRSPSDLLDDFETPFLLSLNKRGSFCVLNPHCFKTFA